MAYESDGMESTQQVRWKQRMCKPIRRNGIMSFLIQNKRFNIQN